MVKDGLSHQSAEGERFEGMQLPTQKREDEPDWSAHAAAPEEMLAWPSRNSRQRANTTEATEGPRPEVTRGLA